MNISFKYIYKRVVSLLILVTFVVTSALPPAYAQTFGKIFMPAPGTMVGLSQPFSPMVLAGVKVDPERPFGFEFIVDPGKTKDQRPKTKDKNLQSSVFSLQSDEQTFADESERLIKYFLASLTTPEKDMWVNLSPYEADRIIPDSFGATEMGRDLLAQDYLLKQITASLIYPEDETGKIFWDRVYKEAFEKFGTTDVPMDTFNKVWIVPDKSVVYENEGVAYVTEASLKVMTEIDYLALEETKDQRPKTKDKNLQSSVFSLQSGKDDISQQVTKDVIIPVLEKEVNEGEHFAQLRQVYHSLILATWYKEKIKDSLLSQIYVDQNKAEGVESLSYTVQPDQIYDQYVAAFKEGVFNYIKEDYDPQTQETIPRKYFSGGVLIAPTLTYAPAMTARLLSDSAQILDVRIDAIGEDILPPEAAMTQTDPRVEAWKKVFKTIGIKEGNHVVSVGSPSHFIFRAAYEEGIYLTNLTIEEELSKSFQREVQRLPEDNRNRVQSILGEFSSSPKKSKSLKMIDRRSQDHVLILSGAVGDPFPESNGAEVFSEALRVVKNGGKISLGSIGDPQLEWEDVGKQQVEAVLVSSQWKEKVDLEEADFLLEDSFRMLADVNPNRIFTVYHLDKPEAAMKTTDAAMVFTQKEQWMIDEAVSRLADMKEVDYKKVMTYADALSESFNDALRLQREDGEVRIIVGLFEQMERRYGISVTSQMMHRIVGDLGSGKIPNSKEEIDSFTENQRELIDSILETFQIGKVSVKEAQEILNVFMDKGKPRIVNPKTIDKYMKGIEAELFRTQTILTEEMAEEIAKLLAMIEEKMIQGAVHGIKIAKRISSKQFEYYIEQRHRPQGQEVTREERALEVALEEIFKIIDDVFEQLEKSGEYTKYSAHMYEEILRRIKGIEAANQENENNDSSKVEEDIVNGLVDGFQAMGLTSADVRRLMEKIDNEGAVYNSKEDDVLTVMASVAYEAGQKGLERELIEKAINEMQRIEKFDRNQQQLIKKAVDIFREAKIDSKDAQTIMELLVSLGDAIDLNDFNNPRIILDLLDLIEDYPEGFTSEVVAEIARQLPDAAMINNNKPSYDFDTRQLIQKWDTDFWRELSEDRYDECLKLIRHARDAHAKHPELFSNKTIFVALNEITGRVEVVFKEDEEIFHRSKTKSQWLDAVDKIRQDLAMSVNPKQSRNDSEHTEVRAEEYIFTNQADMRVFKWLRKVTNVAGTKSEEVEIVVNDSVAKAFGEVAHVLIFRLENVFDLQRMDNGSNSNRAVFKGFRLENYEQQGEFVAAQSISADHFIKERKDYTLLERQETDHTDYLMSEIYNTLGDQYKNLLVDVYQETELLYYDQLLLDRGFYRFAHAVEVAHLGMKIARMLGLSDQEVMLIVMASLIRHAHPRKTTDVPDVYEGAEFYRQWVEQSEKEGDPFFRTQKFLSKTKHALLSEGALLQVIEETGIKNKKNTDEEKTSKIKSKIANVIEIVKLASESILFQMTPERSKVHLEDYRGLAQTYDYTQHDNNPYPIGLSIFIEHVDSKWKRFFAERMQGHLPDHFLEDMRSMQDRQKEVIRFFIDAAHKNFKTVSKPNVGDVNIVNLAERILDAAMGVHTPINKSGKWDSQSPRFVMMNVNETKHIIIHQRYSENDIDERIEDQHIVVTKDNQGRILIKSDYLGVVEGNDALENNQEHQIRLGGTVDNRMIDGVIRNVAGQVEFISNNDKDLYIREANVIFLQPAGYASFEPASFSVQDIHTGAIRNIDILIKGSQITVLENKNTQIKPQQGGEYLIGDQKDVYLRVTIRQDQIWVENMREAQVQIFTEGEVASLGEELEELNGYTDQEIEELLADFYRLDFDGKLLGPSYEYCRKNTDKVFDIGLVNAIFEKHFFNYFKTEAGKEGFGFFRQHIDMVKKTIDREMGLDVLEQVIINPPIGVQNFYDISLKQDFNRINQNIFPMMKNDLDAYIKTLNDTAMIDPNSNDTIRFLVLSDSPSNTVVYENAWKPSMSVIEQLKDREVEIVVVQSTDALVEAFESAEIKPNVIYIDALAQGEIDFERLNQKSEGRSTIISGRAQDASKDTVAVVSQKDPMSVLINEIKNVLFEQEAPLVQTTSKNRIIDSQEDLQIVKNFANKIKNKTRLYYSRIRIIKDGFIGDGQLKELSFLADQMTKAFHQLADEVSHELEDQLLHTFTHGYLKVPKGEMLDGKDGQSWEVKNGFGTLSTLDGRSSPNLDIEGVRQEIIHALARYQKMIETFEFIEGATQLSVIEVEGGGVLVVDPRPESMEFEAAMTTVQNTDIRDFDAMRIYAAAVRSTIEQEMPHFKEFQDVKEVRRVLDRISDVILSKEWPYMEYSLLQKLRDIFVTGRLITAEDGYIGENEGVDWDVRNAINTVGLTIDLLVQAKKVPFSTYGSWVRQRSGLDEKQKSYVANYDRMMSVLDNIVQVMSSLEEKEKMDEQIQFVKVRGAGEHLNEIIDPRPLMREAAMTAAKWDKIKEISLPQTEDDQAKLLHKLSVLRWEDADAEDLQYLKVFVVKARKEFPQYLTADILGDAFNDSDNGVLELIRRSHPHTLQALKNQDQTTHQYRLHEGMYYYLFAMKLLERKSEGPVVLINVDPHPDQYGQTADHVDQIKPTRDGKHELIVRGVTDFNWLSAAVRDGLADFVISAYGFPVSQSLEWMFLKVTERDNGRVISRSFSSSNLPNDFNELDSFLTKHSDHNLYLTVDLDQFALLPIEGLSREPVFFNADEIKWSMDGFMAQLNNIGKISALITADSRDYLRSEVDENWIARAREAVKKSFEEAAMLSGIRKADLMNDFYDDEISPEKREQFRLIFYAVLNHDWEAGLRKGSFDEDDFQKFSEMLGFVGFTAEQGTSIFRNTGFVIADLENVIGEYDTNDDIPQKISSLYDDMLDLDEWVRKHEEAAMTGKNSKERQPKKVQFRIGDEFIEAREAGKRAIDITKLPLLTKKTAMEDFYLGFKPEEGAYFGNLNRSLSDRDGVIAQLKGLKVYAVDEQQEEVMPQAIRIGVGPDATLKELQKILEQEEGLLPKFIGFDIDDTLLGKRNNGEDEDLIEDRRSLGIAIARLAEKGIRIGFFTDAAAKRGYEKLIPAINKIINEEKIVFNEPFLIYGSGAVTKFSVDVNSLEITNNEEYSSPKRMSGNAVKALTEILGGVTEDEIMGIQDKKGLLGKYYDEFAIKEDGVYVIRDDVKISNLNSVTEVTGSGNAMYPNIELREPKKDGSVAQMAIRKIAANSNDESKDLRRKLLIRIAEKFNEAAMVQADDAAVAAKAKTGGIDFTREGIDLDVVGDADPRPLRFDPAQIQHMRNNLRGFEPVIINIRPAINLPLYLGLDTSSEPAHQTVHIEHLSAFILSKN